MAITVVIAEDQARYRDGLKTLLTHQPDFDVVRTWESAVPMLRHARAAHARGKPPPADLILTDIEMPGMSGIEATRELKALWPELSVIVLTVFEEPATILEAICAGVDGYLLKTISAKELLAQLRAITGGGAPMSGGVAKTVLQLLRDHGTPTGVAPSRLELSDREQEVLRCLVRGSSYKQVAADLGISLDTVRTHIRKLYKKLQVHSVAEAVSRAIREGLV
jgi:DNA-binding NarL/FixJ family response regulator